MSAEAGQAVSVIANQTPFYGESGGQMGDTGILFTAEGTEVAVEDTLKKLDDMHIHVGEVTRGALSVGDAVEMRVDGVRRRRLRANHSVTHLMHEVLRRRLGDHVTQKGSSVAPDYMRFDLSQPADCDEYPVDCYRQFLEYIKQRYEGQYWLALPREVARFWRSR